MQMWLIAVLRSLGFQAMSARKQDRLVTGGVWVEGMERVECVWLRCKGGGSFAEDFLFIIT